MDCYLRIPALDWLLILKSVKSYCYFKSDLGPKWVCRILDTIFGSLDPKIKICMHFREKKTKQNKQNDQNNFSLKSQWFGWCGDSKFTEPLLTLFDHKEEWLWRTSKLGAMTATMSWPGKDMSSSLSSPFSFSSPFHHRPSIPWPLTNYSIN